MTDKRRNIAFLSHAGISSLSLTYIKQLQHTILQLPYMSPGLTIFIFSLQNLDFHNGGIDQNFKNYLLDC